MIDQPPPSQLFPHYSELPYSVRVLFTATLLVLGLGYLFALLNIYFTYAGRAGGNSMMLTYGDMVAAYSGSEQGSILEGALQGPMATMLPPDERTALLSWVRQGAQRPTYDSTIKPIIDRRCVLCHDGSNPHLTSLSDYDGLKKVSALDTGASIASLVRLSHIHLFGVTFIFFIVGFIFTHAYIRPVWFKCAVIGLPYLGVGADVSSWYFVKLFHPFAGVVILAGAMNAACFAIMWLVAMYQMWLAKPPEAVLRRMASENTRQTD